MSTPRIYIQAPLRSGEQVELPDGAFRHVVQVLRLREGDALTLFDGRGGEYAAVLEAVKRRTADARVGDFRNVERESQLRVTLGQSVSKGERMDWALQKAVELGVHAVVPVITARCNVRLSDERWEKKRTHWNGIAVAACEQCGRNHVPSVAAPVGLPEWLAANDADRRYVLDAHGRGDALGDLTPELRVALLIGPEGGLTEAEMSAARAAGFRSLRLGPRVLRTETAAAAALAVVQARWGDLR